MPLSWAGMEWPLVLLFFGRYAGVDDALSHEALPSLFDQVSEGHQAASESRRQESKREGYRTQMYFAVPML